MLSTIAFAALGLSLLAGQWESAITAAEKEVERIRAMPEDATKPPQLAGAWNDLGARYSEKGKLREAEQALREALAIYRAMPKPGRGMGWTLFGLAILRVAQRRYSEAEKLYAQAETSMSAEFGPESPQAALVWCGLGEIYASTGRVAEGRLLLERAVPVFEAAGAGALSGQAYFHLARAASEENRIPDAIAAHEKSLAAWRASLGPKHPTIASGLAALAVILPRRDPVEAERLFREAIDILENSLGKDHPFLGPVLLSYSEHLGLMKRKSEARVIKRRGAAILARFERENPAGQQVWDIKSLQPARRK